eukprot:6596597-Pyramimonas_sp.AAC.1
MVLFGHEDGGPVISARSLHDRVELYNQKDKRYRKKRIRFVGKAPHRHRGPLRRIHYYEDEVDLVGKLGKSGRAEIEIALGWADSHDDSQSANRPNTICRKG